MPRRTKEIFRSAFNSKTFPALERRLSGVNEDKILALLSGSRRDSSSLSCSGLHAGGAAAKRHASAQLRRRRATCEAQEKQARSECLARARTDWRGSGAGFLFVHRLAASAFAQRH